MFERFTDKARKVVFLAKGKAIGTEHVLLGLLRVAERQPHADFAAVTLRDLGLDPARVRMLVLDELRQLQA